MLAGMEARAISVKVLASRMSMKGEMFGSGEMTDDKMTPTRRRTRNVRGAGDVTLWALKWFDE